MPNQPKEGLKTLHIRIEPELKDRLVALVELLQAKEPAGQWSQASIIRAGLEREIERLGKRYSK